MGIIVTRSPMRISIAGGGSDVANFFYKEVGHVVSFAINRFVYVTTLAQPSFVEDKFKFTYRITESVNNYTEIKHPVVRQALINYNYQAPLNISTMADLPGNSGFGSSSAFTCALLMNLNKRLAIDMNVKELAMHSIEIERLQLKEPGGWQDQIVTAHGGVIHIELKNGKFNVTKNIIDKSSIAYLNLRLLAIYTHKTRESDVPASINESLTNTKSGMQMLLENAQIASNLAAKLRLEAGFPEKQFEIMCEALKANWEIKKTWGTHMLDSEIEFITSKLESLGVKSYKLSGAGGGGFIIVLAHPDLHSRIRSMLHKHQIISLNVASEGTQIRHYE